MKNLRDKKFVKIKNWKNQKLNEKFVLWKKFRKI